MRTNYFFSFSSGNLRPINGNKAAIIFLLITANMSATIIVTGNSKKKFN